MSPMELHPGQKGIVTVKFDSRGKPGGPHTLEFLATDVRGKADKLPIQFQVDVRRPIFFDSQSVDFGELDPEQPASRSMRLYSEAPLEASRVRIEGLPDKVAFQFHASDQSPKPENHFAYDVKISAPSNSILETVRCTPAVIVRDFQKRDRRFPFNFAATIRPPLSIEPAKAFMGAFNRKEQTLKFDILSKQSVESLSVRGPDWLKIDDHFDPMQKSLELRILRVPEGAPPLAGTFQLTLEARTADQPTTIVSIPVMYVLVE